jgi:hypothetical protein
VYRAVAAIGSYEGSSKKSESVEARYPDMYLSDLRSVMTTSIKSGKTEEPVLEFRFCNFSDFAIGLSGRSHYRGKSIQAKPTLTNRNSMVSTS